MNIKLSTFFNSLYFCILFQKFFTEYHEVIPMCFSNLLLLHSFLFIEERVATYAEFFFFTKSYFTLFPLKILSTL